MSRKLAFTAVCLVAVGSAGCGTGESFPELHPLSGTVTRDGKLIAGGGLIFLPEPHNGSGLVVNASVGPDGTFTATTSRTTTKGADIRPGVPAGTYKAVYHPPGDGQKTGLEVEAAARLTVGPGGSAATVTLPAERPVGRGEDRDDDPASPRFDPKRKD
jgi:hypothetical protein